MNEYPDGKLSDSDEGEIEVKIGGLKGRVVMQFPKPIATIAMQPQEAIDLARLLTRRARRINSLARTDHVHDRLILGGKK